MLTLIEKKNFVATHPIAGTEFSGPEAAHIGLFKGKINIICNKEESSKEAVEKVSELYHIWKGWKTYT